MPTTTLEFLDSFVLQHATLIDQLHPVIAGRNVAIRELYKQGKSAKWLADRTGLSVSMIFQLVRQP